MKEKTVKLNICLSPQEKERLLRNAGKCGISVSQYIVKLSRNIVPREVPTEEFWSLMKQLYELHGDFQKTQSVHLYREIEVLLLKLQEAV